MVPHWEHFAHEADIGVRGFGASPAEAFEQASLALVAVVTDIDRVFPVESIAIACDASDLELLLADWLNTLVFEMATRRMIFGRFEIHIEQHRLRGRAWGERVEPRRHQPAVEVKGATYTALRVAPVAGGWMAQTVVDV